MSNENQAVPVGECPSSADIADETLTSYTLPGGKKVTDAIDAFFRTVIKEGQEVANLIEQAHKEVSTGWYPGCTAYERDLVAALRRYIANESPWGNDPMTKQWAIALATGKMLF